MGIVESARAFASNLPPERRAALKHYLTHRLRWPQHVAYRALFGADLKRLALVYNTDKWGAHFYAPHYQSHFSHLRHRPVKLLEIGVGGYDDPDAGGGSLRMWRTFFPKGQIYGIDLHDKSPHDERRIKTFAGSQIDTDFLQRVIDEIGSPDIIIDDGSHLNEHVIQTFQYLFPRLAARGHYVVEDTQTAYWGDHGGSSTELNRADTSMGFLKALVDCVNHKEFAIENYSPTYYDQNIVGVHFYHNMVFLDKAPNTEPSNWWPGGYREGDQ